jgi:micrococcal nuclease
MKTILCLLLFLGMVGAASEGAIINGSITGKVISVIDGNTIEVLTSDNQKEKFLLAGVDSPELTQEYGERAKKFLEKLVLEREVKVTVQGKDRWGSYLAVIVLVKGDVDPRVELLREGLAWTSEKNPMPDLESHRVAAQEKGKGLWKQDNPTPPWIYRRQQSMLQAKSS